MIKKYWLGFAAIIIVLVISFFIYLFPNQLNPIKNALDDTKLWLGWVLFAIQYLYSKSDKVYLFLNSLRMWVFNNSTKWTLTIDFGSKLQENTLENIWNLTKKIRPNSKLWHIANDLLIINLDGYTLRLFLALSPENYSDNNSIEKNICIQISNLELPYREYKRKLVYDIIPFLHALSELLKPSTEKYVAKIQFSKVNPYFGYFVRKLDLPNVASFTCDILEYSVGGQKQNVTIHKEKMEIVTDNLHALDVLSQKYVSLSWG
jgi:hypothetical protein